MDLTGFARLMLRSAYYAGLGALGLPALMRRFRAAGVVLCYHNVCSTGAAARAGEPAVHLPVDRFAAQARWLARHYDVVPLRELVGRLEAGRPLRGLAAVTFDDGYAGVFTHAWPLLLELGLPATVFVVADAPDHHDGFWWDHPAVAHAATPARRERWLTALRGDGEGILGAATRPIAAPPLPLPPSHRPADWGTIAAAVDAGLELGAHSATHRTLTQLDGPELEREIVSSREAVHARTRTRPAFFAYPYGLWDARVRDAVHSAGYRGAVTLDYGLVSAGTDAWTLRRVNIPAAITLPAFEAWAAGLRPRGRRP